MKTLSKLKIVLTVLIIGLLLSCKDNKDGYSDEIDTRQTPDTTATDTIENKGSNTTGTNTTGATGTESEGVTGAGSISDPGTATKRESTQGTGSGPGESAKDGSTYTISSQTKDTISTKQPVKETKK